ncbi:MAG: hypothetical protein V5A38_00555 [Halolamina sp.]|uniref:DUF7287 family protein n=1 Tax=Halolamina sp. TaxID=1940283 RepID=UPI002FC28FBD
MSSQRRRDWFEANDRGQTVLDFAVAVGIFFVALVFVLGTIPGIFAPFISGGSTQVADRTATSLAADTLGVPDTPYVLNDTCTEGFFRQLNGSGPAPLSCRFDTNASDLHTMLALESAINIRVEIQDPDGSAATIDGTALVAGGTLPERSTVTTARRTVGLEGQSYTLEVHVW